jgi:hypothetical protein
MAVIRKILALALATSAAVSVTSAASATIYYEDPAGAFGALSINTGAFSKTFFGPGSPTGTPLSFPNGYLSVGAVSAATVLLSATDFNFDPAIGLRLYDITANTFANGTLTHPGGPLSDSEWIINTTVTGGHLYSIIVNGTSYGTASNFTGSFTYSASVPEAGTWMMMVAGFGLMGAAMRRRPRTQVTFA